MVVPFLGSGALWHVYFCFLLLDLFFKYTFQVMTKLPRPGALLTAYTGQVGHFYFYVD